MDKQEFRQIAVEARRAGGMVVEIAGRKIAFKANGEAVGGPQRFVAAAMQRAADKREEAFANMSLNARWFVIRDAQREINSARYQREMLAAKGAAQ
mgnify:CR=1 FL=1